MATKSVWETAMQMANEAANEPNSMVNVVVQEPDFSQHPKAQAPITPVAYQSPYIPVDYARVSANPVVSLFNRLIPNGYGTYLTLVVWIGINIATALGYHIPGFDALQGNEGAASLIAVAVGFMRRMIGKIGRA